MSNIVVKDVIKNWGLDNKIRVTLPKHVDPTWFINQVAMCLSETPEMANWQGIQKSFIDLASIGLSPHWGARGHACIIPFKNKATPIIGYKGFVELILRSKKISKIEARAVYASDDFAIHYGTNPRIEHTPKFAQDDFAVGYYAVVFMRDGTEQFEYMSKNQIEAVRKAAPGGKGDAWSNYYDEMAKKTVLRRLIKLIPMVFDPINEGLMNKALEIDNSEVKADFEITEPVVTKGIMKTGRKSELPPPPETEEDQESDQGEEVVEAPVAIVEDLADRLNKAESTAELEAITEDIKSADISPEDKSTLRKIYLEKKKGFLNEN